MMENRTQLLALKGLVNFKTGKLDSNAAKEDGMFPFFTCSQETFRTDTWSFDGEYVLLGGNNAAGIYPLKYFNGRFDAYQRTYAIDSTDENILLTRYVYYALRPQLELMKSTSTGAATKFLTLSMLNQIQIPVPPLPEQTAIATALSDVDNLITSLDKLIDKKINIKQGTMQELLTGKKRLPGFKGEWEVKNLDNVGSFKKGRNIPKKDLTSEGIPCVLYGEIYTKYNYISKKLSSFIPLSIAQQSTSINKGDILFAGSGETAEDIGKCFTYLGDENAYAGGDLNILSPRDADPSFLGYLYTVSDNSIKKSCWFKI